MALLTHDGTWDLPSLRRRLMLTLAHSPEEQEIFSRTFDAFFFAPVQAKEEVSHRQRPWGWQQFWPLALAIGVALAIAMWASRSKSLIVGKPTAAPDSTSAQTGVADKASPVSRTGIDARKVDIEPP